MKVFCDFDGTVAENDVGNLVFQTFADDRWRQAVQEWLDGRITSKECLLRECEAARATPQALIDLADAQKIDPYFQRFVRFCRHRKIPVSVVSDGLDFYIQRILANHGLDDLPVFANHLAFREGDHLVPEFPFADYTCGRCANCKGYHLRTARTPGEWLVYVGDGYSDRCAADEADLVFAKRDLRRYCREAGIAYIEFETFADVLDGLRPFVSHAVSLPESSK